jgi:hypothetical protein
MRGSPRRRRWRRTTSAARARSQKQLLDATAGLREVARAHAQPLQRRHRVARGRGAGRDAAEFARAQSARPGRAARAARARHRGAGRHARRRLLARRGRTRGPAAGARRRPAGRPARAPARRRRGRAPRRSGQRADRRRQGGVLPGGHADRRPTASRRRSSALWFTAPSNFWSLGAGARADAVRRRPARRGSDQAQRDYDQTVANYRGTVLQAFTEVEDNLAALRILERKRRCRTRRCAPRSSRSTSR